MKNIFLLAVMISLASSASALTFKSGTFSALRAMDGTPDAQPAAPAVAGKVTQAPVSPIFPKIIDCTGMGEPLRFYMRLDTFTTWESLPEAGHTPVSVWNGRAMKDETAAQLNDYRGATVTRSVYTYSIWSCDTQDYTFTFDTKSLARQSAAEKERPVTGHVVVETRGHTDDDRDLSCTARY
jgi:hypothetical protein